MSRRVIRRAFENLVDAGDYRKKDKNEVSDYALSFACNKSKRQRKQKSDLLLQEMSKFARSGKKESEMVDSSSRKIKRLKTPKNSKNSHK